MSLLMDALRKAEQAKRQAAGRVETAAAPRPPEAGLLSAESTPADAFELQLLEEFRTGLEQAETLPPVNEREAAPTPDVTEPEFNLDEVSAQSAAHVSAEEQAEPAPGPAAPSPAEAPGVEAHRRYNARTLFVAKQPPRREFRMLRYGAFGGIALVALGACGYLFLLAQDSGSGLGLATGLPVYTPPVVSEPAAVEQAAPAAVEPEPATDAMAVPVSTAPLAKPAPPQRLRSTGPVAEAEPREPAAAPQETRPVPNERLQIRRSAAPSRIEPLLASAYAAQQAGDTHKAHDDYWEALRVEPNNRSAMLGLAGIAVRNGEQAQARALYLRMLERDPRDTVARAGLMALDEGTDPVARESELKNLLADEPKAAHLHFMLGNTYVGQQRWAAAAEAYQNALRLDQRQAFRPEQKNPDYAFNLAVSLEHLGKHEQAIAQYQAALDYARWRTPGFDPATARTRMAALIQSRSPQR